MELEPPNLNIPLKRKEHWGFLLIAVCAAITALVAFINPPFAVAFAASSIVGLPVVLLLFFPPGLSSKLSSWGDFGRIAFFLLLFGYITLSKAVLVPLVIRVIERVLV